MKYFSILKSQFSTQKGFSLIEIMVAIAIMGILLSIITINVSSVQRRTTLTSTLEILLTDLSQQQIKAMVGDTEGRVSTDTYGIHFDSTSYTLFHGTYSAAETSNFTITLPEGQEISSNFSEDDVIFDKGSGDIVDFSESANSIILQDTVTGEQKTIYMNRYGVVTGVN